MNTPVPARALGLASVVALVAAALTGCGTVATSARPMRTIATPPAISVAPKPGAADGTPTPEHSRHASILGGRRAERDVRTEGFEELAREGTCGVSRRLRASHSTRAARPSQLRGRRGWSAAPRREPAHAPERVSIRLEVSEQGRAEASIGAARDTRLAECVRLRFVSQRFGSGEPMVFEAVFGLVQGE